MEIEHLSQRFQQIKSKNMNGQMGKFFIFFFEFFLVNEI